MMADRKRQFIVCLDYGTGGIWGVVRARSESEILAIYPELDIVHQRPPWMTDELYSRYREQEIDIDGAPWGLLNTVLETRERDEQRVGRDRPVFLVGLGDPESGQGKWVFLRAHTQLEIRDRYPELTVLHGSPDWARNAVRDGTMENVALDIDAPPSGLLAEVLVRRRPGAGSPNGAS